MVKKLLMLSVLVMLGACSKKEDAPMTAQTPHVAGTWSGTGTDDAIGYYNIAMTLTQSGGSAAGTFTTSSAFVTQSGNALLQFGNTGDVQTLQLARTQWTTPSTAGRICAGTMTLSQPTAISDSAISFHYTVTDCAGGSWIGGATLGKTAGTN